MEVRVDGWGMYSLLCMAVVSHPHKIVSYSEQVLLYIQNESHCRRLAMIRICPCASPLGTFGKGTL